MANPNRQKRYVNWCVTSFDLENWHVPDQDPHFEYMVYQTEVCPDTQAWHQQAFLRLKRQTDFNTVIAMFSPCIVHLENAQRPAAARKYCMKVGTRLEGTEPMEFGIWTEPTHGAREDLNVARDLINQHTSWSAVVRDTSLTNVMARHMNWCQEVYNARVIPAQLPNIELRNWQKRVIDMLSEDPVKRRIIWIWSSVSGVGKTTFFDYCRFNFKSLRATNLLNTLYLYEDHRVIWFDRARAEKSDSDFLIMLEHLSDLTVHVSTKYKPVEKFVNAHIVVTSNMPPPMTNLPVRIINVKAKSLAEEARDDEMTIDNDE